MIASDRILASLQWELGYSKQPNISPSEFYPAQVPGAVQLDIAREKQYPDYAHGNNFEMFGWMEDLYYTYRASFLSPVLTPGQSLWFVSKGIDYEFEIILNGQLLHRQEGMFTPVEVDLTSSLAHENILEVRIAPVPKRVPYPIDRSQASHVVKPAVSYGWDWHPRLIPLGIWDETGIEIRNSTFIDTLDLRYELSENFKWADIVLQVQLVANNPVKYVWWLKDPSGNQVFEKRGDCRSCTIVECSIDNPRLWWTHDHGMPELYESVFEILDEKGYVLDRQTTRVGFRRIRLVPNDGAWNEPKDFPKGPSVSPIQLELNGRPIFAKGTNWVNPEIFPGTITEQRYQELLEIARTANFNLLRIWGGGIVNKESFYDLCDRMGLLVWQEFPLACNNYPDDAHYLSILEQEAVSIIKRLRNHACLAIWCGGNELFNSWSGMTDQSLALRLLNALCYRYDRQTPFLPTSPVYGMGHGNYVFKWEGKEVLETMIESRNTAYTEFGIPGLPSRSVLERALPVEELFPPRDNSAWQSHHAYHAWDVMPDTWLCASLLEEYFGKARSLDELIEQSQLLQSVGYKAIFEEARRQKPYCSMALNWCFNDVWPAAANNSLVAYPKEPKPALGAVSASCRPVCASARVRKFVWTAGEIFEAELWLLNDRFTEAPGVLIKSYLIWGADSQFLLEWHTPNLVSNRNEAGPTLRFILPSDMIGCFSLRLEVVGHPEYDSEYTLLCRGNKAMAKKDTAIMNV